MTKRANSIEETMLALFEAGRFLKQQETLHGKGMLSHVRFETLSFVSEAGQPTMNDLAQHFNIEAPSATSLVDHLVRAKQLARVPDPKDKRRVRLALTPQGKRDLKQSLASKRAQWSLLLGKLSEAERAQLAHIFKKLSR